LSKSKRIKQLESKVEQISSITDVLILLVNELIEKEKLSILESGKWYKNTP
jgi:hypothetical protein